MHAKKKDIKKEKKYKTICRGKKSRERESEVGMTHMSLL